MVRVLTWIFDVLIVLILVRAALRMLFGSRSSPAKRAASSSPERSGGTLVRDPHCGTYLPESRAIRVGSGARVLFFCSTACRDAHAAAEAKGA